ncbi:MAG: HlyD family efflux transporter periplasmic adaptor subunit [Terriglobia bacterium]
MRIGETSLRVTSLLASGLRRPKLRRNLKVSRQVVLGEVSYVVKVPETDSHYRFEDFEWETLELFDGTRTYREAWEELRQRDPETETALADVEDYVAGVDPALWERTVTEKNLALLEKIRAERKERSGGQNIFYMVFPGINPDALFHRIHPHLRWLWTRGFVWVSLALFALALWVLVIEWKRIAADTAALYSFEGKAFGDLVQLWVLFLLAGFIHEFGHGLTCYHYGGEVKQMGFLLMYFLPAFYTDVSDMYLFDKDSKRVWTIFAGIWIESVACAIAIILWMISIPGTAFNDWAYKAVLITSITGLLLNLNPFMKYDGYYALTQVVKLDNLREDSFDYLQAWVKRHLFRMKRVEVESVGRRRRRIFLVFGTLTLLYTGVVLTIILLFAKNVLTSKFGLWGWVLTALLTWLVLRSRVRGLGRFLRDQIRKVQESVMKWQFSRAMQVTTGGVLLLVFLVPTTIKVSTGFVLEPGTRAFVRAETAGWVEEVKVAEGQEVATGTEVARLRNAEVEARVAILARQLAGEERALAAAQARDDVARFREHWERREQLRGELAEARARRAKLVLRAPLAGVVRTPRLAERVGQFLAQGASFCEIVDRRMMRARVLVPDRELEEIEEPEPDVEARARVAVLDTEGAGVVRD